MSFSVNAMIGRKNPIEKINNAIIATSVQDTMSGVGLDNNP